MLMQDLEKTLEPIFYYYKQRRRPAESLGDFTARIGFDTLRKYCDSYMSAEELSSAPQVGNLTQSSMLISFLRRCARDCHPSE